MKIDICVWCQYTAQDDSLKRTCPECSHCQDCCKTEIGGCPDLDWLQETVPDPVIVQTIREFESKVQAGWEEISI